VKTMKLWMAALLVTCAGVTGCSSGYSVELETSTNAPVAVAVSGEQIDLAAGIAVGVTAKVKRGNNEVGEDEEVDFVSDDPGVVQIAPRSGGGGFVIFGVSEGEGSITLRVDDVDRLSIPVTVHAQD
jgi:hypothetical protein